MESTEARRELDKLKKKAKRNKKVLIAGGVVVGYIIFRRSVNKQVAKAMLENAPSLPEDLEFLVTPEQIRGMVERGAGIGFDTKFGQFVMLSGNSYNNLIRG